MGHNFEHNIVFCSTRVFRTVRTTNPKKIYEILKKINILNNVTIFTWTKSTIHSSQHLKAEKFEENATILKTKFDICQTCRTVASWKDLFGPSGFRSLWEFGISPEKLASELRAGQNEAAGRWSGSLRMRNRFQEQFCNVRSIANKLCRHIFIYSKLKSSKP